MCQSKTLPISGPLTTNHHHRHPITTGCGETIKTTLLIPTNGKHPHTMRLQCINQIRDRVMPQIPRITQCNRSRLYLVRIDNLTRQGRRKFEEGDINRWKQRLQLLPTLQTIRHLRLNLAFSGHLELLFSILDMAQLHSTRPKEILHTHPKRLRQLQQLIRSRHHLIPLILRDRHCRKRHPLRQTTLRQTRCTACPHNPFTQHRNSQVYKIYIYIYFCKLQSIL